MSDKEKEEWAKKREYKPELLRTIPTTLKEAVEQLKKEFMFVNMCELREIMTFEHMPHVKFNRCVIASNKGLFKKPKKFNLKNLNIDLNEIEIRLKWIIEGVPIFEIIEEKVIYEIIKKVFENK